MQTAVSSYVPVPAIWVQVLRATRATGDVRRRCIVIALTINIWIYEFKLLWKSLLSNVRRYMRLLLKFQFKFHDISLVKVSDCITKAKEYFCILNIVVCVWTYKKPWVNYSQIIILLASCLEPWTDFFIIIVLKLNANRWPCTQTWYLCF